MMDSETSTGRSLVFGSMRGASASMESSPKVKTVTDLLDEHFARLYSLIGYYRIYWDHLLADLYLEFFAESAEVAEDWKKNFDLAHRAFVDVIEVALGKTSEALDCPKSVPLTEQQLTFMRSIHERNLMRSGCITDQLRATYHRFKDVRTLQDPIVSPSQDPAIKNALDELRDCAAMIVSCCVVWQEALREEVVNFPVRHPALDDAAAGPQHDIRESVRRKIWSATGRPQTPRSLERQVTLLKYEEDLERSVEEVAKIVQQSRSTPTILDHLLDTNTLNGNPLLELCMRSRRWVIRLINDLVTLSGRCVWGEVPKLDRSEVRRWSVLINGARKTVADVKKAFTNHRPGQADPADGFSHEIMIVERAVRSHLFRLKCFLALFENAMEVMPGDPEPSRSQTAHNTGDIWLWQAEYAACSTRQQQIEQELEALTKRGLMDSEQSRLLLSRMIPLLSL
jgi:hypothetical protein